MGYIEDFQRDFREMLAGKHDAEAIVAYVADKLVESYRNGLVDGKKSLQRGDKRPPKARNFGQAK